MWTGRIFPYICELEFGSPSNEAMNCVSFTIASGLFLYEKMQAQEQEVTDKQKIGIAIGIVNSLVQIILFCL